MVALVHVISCSKGIGEGVSTSSPIGPL